MPREKLGTRHPYHEADDVTLSANIVEAVADTHAMLHQGQIYRWQARHPAAGAQAKTQRRRSRQVARRLVQQSRPQECSHGQ